MNAQKALAVLALTAAPSIALAQPNNSAVGAVGTGAAAQAPGTITPGPKRAGVAGRAAKQPSKTPDSSDLPPQPTPNIIRYR